MYYFLQPVYEGSGFETVSAVAIMGVGRLLGNVATNVVLHNRVEIGGRDVLVRGLFAPSRTSPNSADAVYLYGNLQMEFWEAVVGAGLGKLAGAEDWGTAGQTWFVMGMIALTDLIYGLVSTRSTKEWFYYLVDDRAGEKNYWLALFRRGASDAIFYTAMGLVWSNSVSAATEKDAWAFMFGMGWIFRNAGHRFARIEIWYRVKRAYRSWRPDTRTPLVHYQDGESTSIYVSVQNGKYQSSFVYSWAQDRQREIKLDRIMGYIKQVAYDPTSSWEQIAQQRQLLQQIPQRRQVTHQQGTHDGLLSNADQQQSLRKANEEDD
jgi:hypothetical protein